MMSIIDRVVYYLNDILVSLDISPILKIEEKKEKSKINKSENDNIQA